MKAQADRAVELAQTFKIPTVIMRRALALGCPVDAAAARQWLIARGMVAWKANGKAVLLQTT